jgi:peroxiredoxin
MMLKLSKPAGTIENRLRNLRLSNVILAATIIVALGSLVLGLVQNRRLGVENKLLHLQLQRVAAVDPCDIARPGDLVPPIEADNVEGKTVRISYTGASKYLLFIFSPTCHDCVEQFSQWRELAKPARSKGWVVFGLSTGEQDILLNANDVGFEVLRIRDAAVLRAYRINVVPSVMLVSEHGKTQWVHSGALDGLSLKELLSVMDGVTVLS